MADEPVVRCVGCGTRWAIEAKAAAKYRKADIIAMPPCPKCGGQRVTDNTCDRKTASESDSGKSGGASCAKCGKPYGELASLGFQKGGYKCLSCGAQSCDRCCYAKAKEIGRATMICPQCGSDQTQVFTN